RRSILGQFALQDVMICNAARVERFYFDSQALLPEVVRQELLIGAEQVGDTHFPSVSVHLQLKKLLFTFLFPHLDSLERQSQLDQSAAAHSSDSNHDTAPPVTLSSTPTDDPQPDSPANTITVPPPLVSPPLVSPPLVSPPLVSPPLVPPVSSGTLLLLAHPSSETVGRAVGRAEGRAGGAAEEGGGGGEAAAANAADNKEDTGGGGRSGRSTSIREAVKRH
ncbi:unnamed protein product, partial [Closterium sp. Yama58-4]